MTPPSFESLKKLNQNGLEYWSARDLRSCLGYTEWRKFENTIKKAIGSCQQSGNDPCYHFVGADNPIISGKGRTQVIDDYHLSRFACYLIAQNGDPRKPEIAGFAYKLTLSLLNRFKHKSSCHGNDQDTDYKGSAIMNKFARKIPPAA